MMTQPSKNGKTTEVYFDKKHHWVSDGDEYVDRLKYRETQKEKKKGFLSGDFKRRDEYSMVFRTEQYREQLKGEDKLAKETLDEMEEEDGEYVVCPFYSLFPPPFALRSEKSRRLSIDATK